MINIGKYNLLEVKREKEFGRILIGYAFLDRIVLK